MTQQTVRPDGAAAMRPTSASNAATHRSSRLARDISVAAGLLALCAATAPAVAQVRALYGGDDHGVLYARQIGDRFVAFGEHPVQKYAFVMRGRVRDNMIDAEWWDIPKWGRGAKGRAVLQISQGGARMVRKSGDDFGSDTYSAINVNQIPAWPGSQEAGSQSASDSNITGAFTGSDDSRWYVRETPFNVAGVAEGRTAAGGRPSWVSVFFARREANGHLIQGDWIDVPKGTATQHGALRLTPRPGKWPREMFVALSIPGRTTYVDPDFNVDLDALSAGIAAGMQGSGAVGWAFAIAKGGKVVRERAGGIRSREVSPALPFDSHTLGQAGSFTKFATAATLAKVLKSKGLNFDSPVRPFLPGCWADGPGMANLTFGDIARHHSGFSDQDLPDNAYLRVDTLLRRGKVKALAPDAFDYLNANYDVLRYIVPLVGRRAEAVAILGDMCGANAVGNVMTSTTINRRIAALFVDMLLDGTLKPAGVTEASFLPTTGNFAILYDWRDPSVPGRLPNPIGPDNAGAGFLAISARAGAQLLASFDQGRIVSNEWVRQMKSRLYGFNPSPYLTKAGYVSYKPGGSDVPPHYHISAYGMLFPGDVQVYLTITSGFKLEGGINAGKLVANAYDAAFR